MVAMTGAPRPRVAMATLNINQIMNASVDWITHAPNAPRTSLASQLRKATSPTARLRSGGERRKFLRSPVFRRTPTGRRRERKADAAKADGSSSDPTNPPAPFTASDSFNALMMHAASVAGLPNTPTIAPDAVRLLAQSGARLKWAPSIHRVDRGRLRLQRALLRAH